MVIKMYALYIFIILLKTYIKIYCKLLLYLYVDSLMGNCFWRNFSKQLNFTVSQKNLQDGDWYNRRKKQLHTVGPMCTYRLGWSKHHNSHTGIRSAWESGLSCRLLGKYTWPAAGCYRCSRSYIFHPWPAGARQPRAGSRRVLAVIPSSGKHIINNNSRLALQPTENHGLVTHFQ